MSNTAFEMNLSVLRSRFGDFTKVAQHLQVDPRTIRDQRTNPNSKAQRRVAVATKLVRLRQLLQVLRLEHHVSSETLRQAMQAADKQLKSKRSL